jgi:hypothetical protein
VRYDLFISVADCSVCGGEHDEVRFYVHENGWLGICPVAFDLIRMNAEESVYRALLAEAGADAA